jgi:hypothetical protein
MDAIMAQNSRFAWLRGEDALPGLYSMSHAKIEENTKFVCALQAKRNKGTPP